MAALWLTAALCAGASQAAAQQTAAVPVTVQPLRDLVVEAVRSAPAEVVPANRTTLAAELAASILRIGADVGTSVKRGELLIELDASDYTLDLRRNQGELASLQAQIAQAEIRLRRAEALAEKQYASEDELLALTTSLAVLRRNADVQRVDVEIATLNLSRTKIRAPFDGVIEQRFAQQGAYVAPGGALLTLTETSNREIAAALHPDLVEGLRNADRIVFDGPGPACRIRLLRVSEVIDPETGTRTVRLSFEDTPAPIGATGTIEWSETRGLIPVHLIVQRDGRLGVFVARDDSAQFHVLDHASEGRAAPHDLPPDISIVVEGRNRLQDGDRLQIRRQ